MRTLKLKARVADDHTIRLELPEDVKAGLADVIVLLHDESPSKTPSLADVLSQLESAPPSSRSKEAIDQALALERESWD